MTPSEVDASLGYPGLSTGGPADVYQKLTVCDSAALSSSEKRSLSGNGMHLACAGALELYVCSNTIRREVLAGFNPHDLCGLRCRMGPTVGGRRAWLDRSICAFPQASLANLCVLEVVCLHCLCPRTSLDLVSNHIAEHGHHKHCRVRVVGFVLCNCHKKLALHHHRKLSLNVHQYEQPSIAEPEL